MNNESFQLYIERLARIRETLTDPKRIQFIDDIIEALRYKDAIIDNLHVERSKLMESEMKLRTERDRFKSQRNIVLNMIGRLEVK